VQSKRANYSTTTFCALLYIPAKWRKGNTRNCTQQKIWHRKVNQAWALRFSGMLCCPGWPMSTDCSGKHAGPIFKCKAVQEDGTDILSRNVGVLNYAS
jgi:hypothetical protein